MSSSNRLKSQSARNADLDLFRELCNRVTLLNLLIFTFAVRWRIFKLAFFLTVMNGPNEKKKIVVDRKSICSVDLCLAQTETNKTKTETIDVISTKS